MWNPYIFSGTPLAANPQVSLYNPLSILFYFLPLEPAFDWNAFLHLVLAFGGAALLCRRWRLSASGAFALAAAYALSPFLIYRIPQGVPTMLACLAYVPWVWLGLESGPLLFSLTLALQLLSGHPQFMAINLVGMALYLLMRRRRGLKILLLGGLFAAAATTAQWMPTLEFLAHSIRAHWSALYAGAYSLEASYLYTLLFPGAAGNPLSSSFTGYPSVFFEMAGLSLGMVPLALAVLGLSRTRNAWTLGALAFAGLFLALGDNNPLLRPLLEVPGLGSLRVPARWALLTLWALWMASVCGWRLLSDGMTPVPGTGGKVPSGRRTFGDWARLAPRWSIPAALSLVIVVELGRWDARFLYAQDPGGYLSVNREVVAALRRTPQRYATSPLIPNPNKGMLYRLMNVTGYEAFYLAGAARHASLSQGRPSADGSHLYVEDFGKTGFKAVALRYYLAESPRELPLEHGGGRPARLKNDPRGRPTLVSGGISLYEDPDAQPLAYHEGSSSPDPSAPRLVEVRPESWTLVETVPPGSPALILAQADYPGWKAWIGEREVPVETHEGFLQKIRPGLPPGSQVRVHLRFEPDLWTLARLLSVLSLTLACMVIFYRLPHLESRLHGL